MTGVFLRALSVFLLLGRIQAKSCASAHVKSTSDCSKRCQRCCSTFSYSWTTHNGVGSCSCGYPPSYTVCGSSSGYYHNDDDDDAVDDDDIIYTTQKTTAAKTPVNNNTVDDDDIPANIDVHGTASRMSDTVSPSICTADPDPCGAFACSKSYSLSSTYGIITFESTSETCSSCAVGYGRCVKSSNSGQCEEISATFGDDYDSYDVVVTPRAEGIVDVWVKTQGVVCTSRYVTTGSIVGNKSYDHASHEKNTGSDLGLYIGISVGAILLVCIIVSLVAWIRIRKSKNDAKNDDDDDDDNALISEQAPEPNVHGNQNYELGVLGVQDNRNYQLAQYHQPVVQGNQNYEQNYELGVQDNRNYQLAQYHQPVVQGTQNYQPVVQGNQHPQYHQSAVQQQKLQEEQMLQEEQKLQEQQQKLKEQQQKLQEQQQKLEEQQQKLKEEQQKLQEEGTHQRQIDQTISIQ